MTTEERLEKLEKELADMKERIRSKSFELVDDKGKLRALLGVSTINNTCVFGLCDKNGKVRIRLTVDESGPELVLYDELDNVRAGLGVDKSKTSLAFGDEQGKLRVTLGIVEKRPALMLMDENGKTRVTLFASDLGSFLELYGIKEESSVGMSIIIDPKLTLKNEKGKQIWSAP